MCLSFSLPAQGKRRGKEGGGQRERERYRETQRSFLAIFLKNEGWPCLPVLTPLSAVQTSINIIMFTGERERERERGGREEGRSEREKGGGGGLERNRDRQTQSRETCSTWVEVSGWDGV